MLARCMPVLFGEIDWAPNGVARWIAVLGAQAKRRQAREYKVVELPAFRFAGRSAYSETGIPVRREKVRIA